jgi:hypothetical protein
VAPRAVRKKALSPCRAPRGTDWVWAYSSHHADSDDAPAGKWLIYVRCPQVAYCWELVRMAVEEGSLGPCAKVITDWAMSQTGESTHVICVYTSDFRNQADVLRVAQRLFEVDAVRKQVLRYKPDVFTYTGQYATAKDPASIYSAAPPYSSLQVSENALAAGLALLSGLE